MASSTRIKDAGIAIRHSQGYTFSILQGPERDLREWKRCVDTQKQKTISKGYVFLIEKYFEDARRDEKHVPDLLGSIIQPPDPVKDELRQKLFKMTQFGSKIKIQENEGFKILDSGNPKFSRRRPTQPSRPVGFQQETAFHIPINPIFGPARGKIYQKCRF